MHFLEGVEAVKSNQEAFIYCNKELEIIQWPHLSVTHLVFEQY